MIETLVGLAFDTYINLRYMIAEAGKQIGWMIDDALNVFDEDDE